MDPKITSVEIDGPVTHYAVALYYTNADASKYILSARHLPVSGVGPLTADEVIARLRRETDPAAERAGFSFAKGAVDFGTVGCTVEAHLAARKSVYGEGG